MTNFIIKHNLAVNFANHLTAICPDSNITKQYQCKRVIQLYMHMKVFSTKVVSLHRASNTEPKKHKNLLGKPLLKKLDDETQKKVRVQT